MSPVNSYLYRSATVCITSADSPAHSSKLTARSAVQLLSTASAPAGVRLGSMAAVQGLEAGAAGSHLPQGLVSELGATANA
eukprot:CAMPEP_0202916576 /NCGR_PEP_ID=MMETSP1392-20130828/68924_1 /ASSEMBLY_ACC=CAM_ASM_000868 /TAXON_ID=225041 /ORGANISM="Chlamydomonas chlamydogama, Strain SAG 11-48b" /LENGTH=80 /DNA_ID=CAMNT_0049609065 /DNA_START=327 /DNA_END=568 /DNA_ORIENTATION=-